MLRACFKAAPGYRLLVADWSQIEARELAWAADDVDALEVFDAGDAGDKVNGEPYVANACAIFGGKPADYFETDASGKLKIKAAYKAKRQTGKVATLGLGYQMGAPRFEEWSTEQGTDWSTVGSEINGVWVPLTAFDVVQAWRTAHAPIVSFWYELQDAFVQVTQFGGEVDVGPFTIANLDGLVVNRLPSGRLIAYQGMSVSWEPDAYGRERPRLKYASRKGPEHTFGGKLTENGIQATSGCLLRRAQVECERVGLPVVLTVHDEIVCEVPEREADEGLEVLLQILCDVPSWAEGLPLNATGFHCDRYQKG